MTSGAIDAATTRALQRLAADCQRVWGDRFVACVAGEHGATAVFASEIRAEDLDALGALAATWHQEQLPTPLVLTPAEFRRSLDTFPAEYQALLDRHVVVAGRPPFDDARVNPADLRRACEAQARGHLIHLRQGWIDAGSDPRGLAQLVARSAGPLRLLLANLARLHGETPADDAALAEFAGRVAELDAALVRDVLALDDAPYRAKALVARLPAYLNATESLWTFIDRWPSP